MSSEILFNTTFIKKFSRYLVLGFMLLFLGLMGQVGVLGEVWERGPLATLAAEMDYPSDSVDAAPAEAPAEAPQEAPQEAPNEAPSAGGPGQPVSTTPKSGPGQPAITPQQPAQCVPQMKFLYPEERPGNQQCEVWQNSCDGSYEYRNCSSLPAPVCETKFLYPECRPGGQQCEVWQKCDGSYEYRNCSQAPAGVCGNPVPQPQPTVTPAPTPVAPPAPVVAPVQEPKAVCFVCDNNTWRQASGGQQMTQAQCAAISNSGWNQPQAPAWCAPAAPVAPAAPTQRQTITQTQTQCSDGTIVALASQCQQQQQSQQNQVQNTNTATATGGSVNVSGGVGNNSAPAGVRTVLAAAPAQTVAQPKVLSEVKSLPATGLPLLAWGLAGLAPVGSRLRKFGANKEERVGPDYLWEQREFLKN